MSKKKRWILSLALVALVAVVLAAGMTAWSGRDLPKRAVKEADAEIQALYEPSPEPSLRFKELLARNPDTIGWIQIADTAVDYPILHTSDNDFYLHHDFNKNPSAAGQVFMDYRNKGDGSDMNMILYGHSMADGSIFSGLFAFKDEDFFRSHRILEIDTIYGLTRWEIFSAYVTSPDFYYIHTDFYYPTEEQAFKDAIAAKSKYPTGIRLTLEDRILTLSTCSYEFEDAYFVIHARKIL